MKGKFVKSCAFRKIVSILFVGWLLSVFSSLAEANCPEVSNVHIFANPSGGWHVVGSDNQGMLYVGTASDKNWGQIKPHIATVSNKRMICQYAQGQGTSHFVDLKMIDDAEFLFSQPGRWPIFGGLPTCWAWAEWDCSYTARPLPTISEKSKQNALKALSDGQISPFRRQ